MHRKQEIIEFHYEHQGVLHVLHFSMEQYERQLKYLC
jgi:hypothetical protein